MSSFSSLCGLFSSRSSGNWEHGYNDSSTEPYLPLTAGGDADYLDEHPFVSDPRDRDTMSPPASIPQRDYLSTDPNFLVKSFCSSLSLNSYSLGRHVSYPWEVSVANPLPGPFASVGMPPIDTIEEPNQDPVLSSSLARSDLEDGLDIHYINPPF